MQKGDKANSSASELRILLSGIFTMCKPKQCKTNVFERIVGTLYVDFSHMLHNEVGRVLWGMRGLLAASYSICDESRRL